MQPANTFVQWFRASSPYIHAHRQRTVVVFFNGDTRDAQFDRLIHDFALLKSLGIRLVLVYGIRSQIERELKEQGITPRYHRNLRVTDSEILPFVKEAAGLVRVEIEALLSMGLANSPMAGAKIRVASGNFVTAKPLGVIDGVDFCNTGKVRKIDSAAIKQQLDQDYVVLIAPIGYSPSGEVFNLSAEDLATEVAIALQAEKLILLTEQRLCLQDNQAAISQLTLLEAQQFLQQQPDLSETTINSLQAAIKGCQQGVQRVHLLDRHIDGALLLELFSRDGIGTLISARAFEEIRPATLDDIGGILELIKPLEQQGKLVKRSREKLEMDINDYIVIERDGSIIGCTAFHVLNADSAELACLAVHRDYQRGARGNWLLEHLTHKAKQQGIKRLFVLSTQTMHWFLERGFVPCAIDELPEKLRHYYNYQRNSKAFYKVI